MLHIILGILKIIGIVLGILLLLLLAAVLAVILVPVRYRIQAKKREDEVCAGIKVSWLLHIVSASFKINKRAEHEIAIRLFGIRLPLFGTKKKKKRGKRRAVPAKVREPEDVPEPEGVLTEEDSLEDDTSEESYGVLEDGYVSEDEDVPGDADAEDDVPDDTEKVSGCGKIRFSFQGICDKIKAVYGKIQALIRRLFSLLELAERLEAREVLRDVFGYLSYLLRHYAPRSIRGFLRFGTGDPSVTGQLTGLIYLILPARADHFTVQPEFGDAVLETDISCKGHIRAVHLIRVLWWGFRNKKLRRIIRYRSRGGSRQ